MCIRERGGRWKSGRRRRSSVVIVDLIELPSFLPFLGGWVVYKLLLPFSMDIDCCHLSVVDIIWLGPDPPICVSGCIGCHVAMQK